MKKIRQNIALQGLVQGVGFRPFVYRLASQYHLAGWVKNGPEGVEIEVEGRGGDIEGFCRQLKEDLPSISRIDSLQIKEVSCLGEGEFAILPSQNRGEIKTLILPDLATCPGCLEDIFNPQNRRYFYPFTSCTYCGPRYSIVENLPYDRSHTTMKDFALCKSCRLEYEDPANRRFHAQPIACADCGPHLALWDGDGRELARRHQALERGVEILQRGQILALKGLGGFQLLVAANDREGVKRLGEKKNRQGRPFALMYGQVENVKNHCYLSTREEELLTSPAAPIVLLRRKKEIPIAPEVAPQCPYLGVMVAYTPLHHLLLESFHQPVVATSGNRSGEILSIDEKEALERLGGIADYFLVHNRPISVAIDDSVIQVVRGQTQILRRARGYVPLPLDLEKPASTTAVALGGDLKNTAAFVDGDKIFLTQHLGDLESESTYRALERETTRLPDLYEREVHLVACDLHPGYLSTGLANQLNLPLVKFQHHYAHLLAAAAEAGWELPCLGVIWDGTGWGPDGTVWGGEFLVARDQGFQRQAYFLPFPLPGGEAAVREPRRSALGLLDNLGKVTGQEDLPPVKSFSPLELKILSGILKKKDHAPLTSSVGRLFDGVSSLLGIRQFNRFEGEAAMALEWALPQNLGEVHYEFDLGQILKEKERPWMIDWSFLLENILDDLRGGIDKGEISLKFHNTLVEMTVAFVKKVGEKRVLLSGGCFQNRYLLGHSLKRLSEEGIEAFSPQKFPPGDGGISLGQAYGISLNM